MYYERKNFAQKLDNHNNMMKSLSKKNLFKRKLHFLFSLPSNDKYPRFFELLDIRVLVRPDLDDLGHRLGRGGRLGEELHLGIVSTVEHRPPTCGLVTGETELSANWFTRAAK